MRARSILGKQGGNSGGGGVNVTPMIDVVMCLIVFYLMVGQLALDRKSSIVVAETETGIDRQDVSDAVVIGVLMDGGLTLNGEAIEIDRIGGEVSGMIARDVGVPIRVRADEEAGFGAVRPVLWALQEAGVSGVEFVTLRADGGMGGGG
ncbi:MAG: biopolymer transporter ExbD [Phycisphaerales bacterium]